MSLFFFKFVVVALPVNNHQGVDYESSLLTDWILSLFLMTVFSNKDFHDHDFKNVIEVETIHIWTRKSSQVEWCYISLN